MRALLPVRLSVIAAVLAALFVCNAAMAQVSGMASPTPTIGTTSPLGLGTSTTVSPTGIPLGSTEVASPGVSPAPGDATGTISMPGSSTTCSTIGTAPSSMFGSTASFDGGGMAMGTAAPATATSGMSTSSGISATSGMSTTSGMLQTSGMSGMCGSGSSSIISSSTPTSTSPTTPGGGARTGIPMGSTEIGNLGVSSAAAVPTLSVTSSGSLVGPTAVVPVMPTVTSPAAASSATTSTSVCPNTGLPSSTTGGC
jgi:hypothetical protein